MSMLPTVTNASYCGDYRVLVAFSDGVEGVVDFRPWLHGPVFDPLKDLTFFQRFYIDGGTLAWPNGADIAPETLHAQAKSAGASRATLQPVDSARG